MSATTTDVTELTDAERIELLEAQVAEAVARAERAEAEAEANSPTADVTGFILDSIEAVESKFSPQHLHDLAEVELASINKTRLKNGFLPINYSEDEWAAAIRKAVDSLLEDRRAVAPPDDGTPLMRTIKMIAPGGRLLQLPFEPQINNQAGSLEDGIARYRNKGYKLPKPMMCPSQDCYEYAALDENGAYKFKAYCSQNHHDRTERIQATPIENVITARQAIKR